MNRRRFLGFIPFGVGGLLGISAPEKQQNRYKAILTQEGMNHPVVRVVENTTGSVFTWTRFAPGQYQVVINPPVPGGSVGYIEMHVGVSTSVMVATGSPAAPNNANLYTWNLDQSPAYLSDDLLRDTAVTLTFW